MKICVVYIIFIIKYLIEYLLYVLNTSFRARLLFFVRKNPAGGNLVFNFCQLIEVIRIFLKVENITCQWQV